MSKSTAMHILRLVSLPFCGRLVCSAFFNDYIFTKHVAIFLLLLGITISYGLFSPILAANSLSRPYSPYSSEIIHTHDAYLPTSFLNQADNKSELSPETSHFRYNLLIWGTTLSFAAYGYTTWWNEATSDFKQRDEGWFGKDTPNGGADKLGHGFSSYLSTRLMTAGFQWAGNNHRRAVKLASIWAASTHLAIEVLDGFTEEFGFSREDFIINMAGVGLGYLLETNPKLDALFDIRLRYWPSDDARLTGEKDPIADYSGQTYFLITKATGIPALDKNPFLRYFELAAGYGSRGYSPAVPDSTIRSRNIYFGLSLNLAAILDDTVFHSRKQKSNSQKLLNGLFEYYQVPNTAALNKKKF